MKIVFFGTSDFAVPALKALAADFEIVAVITTPDQPAGRNKVLTPPPVKIAAEVLGLKILQPATLKDDAFFEEFKSLAPDLCVVAAYGKIIPQRYLSVPKYFLNIHPSLLPKYRGPTPIQSAILNGETKTGITIMQVDKEVDHGAIFLQKEFAISSDETYQQLHNHLADKGAELLIDVVKKIAAITPREQDHSQATFTKIFKREDARIDWTRSSQEIYNQIRALNPEPGAWTTWQDKVLNIKKAALIGGKFSIVTIQLEGKKETSFADFLSGHPDFDIAQLK